MSHEFFILERLTELAWLCCRIVLKKVDIFFLLQNSLFVLLDGIGPRVIVHFLGVVLKLDVHCIISHAHRLLHFCDWRRRPLISSELS